MRPSTARLLFIVSPLALGGLVPAVACDAELEPSFEFRSTVHEPSLLLEPQLMDLDPVPGGGGCEGCVTCFQPGKGFKANICLRTDTHFTGSSVSVKDDASLSFGDKEFQWQIYGATGTPLCSGESCAHTTITEIAPDQVKLELTFQYSAQDIASGVLRLISIPEGGWRKEPEIAIPDDLGEEPLEDSDHMEPPAPHAVADAVTPAMAHITYPAKSGGVHSCSGFLITEDLVLTAAHCLVEPRLMFNSQIPGWPGWQRVPVADLRVRVGGLGAPDDPSFPYDSSHGAVAIHIYPDPNVDLALVKLANPTGVAPLVLANPFLLTPSPPTFAAYGYGVAGLPVDSGPEAYDWGRLKRTSLQEEFLERQKFVYHDDIITFAHPEGSIGVCHGDSGGPVIRTVNGTHQVVGVMLARVVDSDEGVPEEGGVTNHEVQHLSSRGFAFSRHNRCGLNGSPLAYVAARLDREDVRAWLAGFTNASLPPACELPYEPAVPPATF